MAGPTFWEVHEYVDGLPVLAFVAGAGGHAAADEFGTTFYVDNEAGWRDGTGMYDSNSQRLMNDGEWTGPQYKQPFLVTLSGYWVSPSQEAMFASMRRARNTLGRQHRTGRLVAHDSDNKRLFADVVRGGGVLMAPSTSLVGEWSMVFKVSDPVYYSEEIRTSLVRPITTQRVGMGFPMGFPMAFQTSSVPPGNQVVGNGGDVPVPFQARITGPLSGFTLTDSATGRTLVSNVTLSGGQTALLDTKTKTFTMGGTNLRHTLSGKWFHISPGASNVVFSPLASFTANTTCAITHHAEAWGG